MLLSDILSSHGQGPADENGRRNWNDRISKQIRTIKMRVCNSGDAGSLLEAYEAAQQAVRKRRDALAQRKESARQTLETHREKRNRRPIPKEADQGQSYLRQFAVRRFHSPRGREQKTVRRNARRIWRDERNRKICKTSPICPLCRMKSALTGLDAGGSSTNRRRLLQQSMSRHRRMRRIPSQRRANKFRLLSRRHRSLH